MTTVKYPVAIVCTFVWIGFVCAISFMEAWLKFQAPDVTIAIGLGIGKIVFAVLNKVEWVMALAITLNLLIIKHTVFRLSKILFLIALALLALQTLWLLPALDKRADAVISGISVPGSSLHFYFVAVELIKVGCLAGFGCTLFRHVNINLPEHSALKTKHDQVITEP